MLRDPITILLHYEWPGRCWRVIRSVESKTYLADLSIEVSIDHFEI